MKPVTIKYKYKNIKYEIPLAGKYTFIQGNSATGKSSFFRLVENHSITAHGMQVLTLPANLPLRVDLMISALDSTAGNSHAIYVGDEHLRYLHSQEFQQAMTRSKHLFLIIQRSAFSAVPHSVDSLCQFISVGGVITAVPRHVPCPASITKDEISKFQGIYVEDSKGGYEIIKSLYDGATPYHGNGNAYTVLAENENIVVLFDSLGFGAHMDKCINYLQNHRDCHNRLLAWKSFEYMIYKNLFDGQEEAPWECSNTEDFYTTRVKSILTVVSGTGYNKTLSSECIRLPCCSKYKWCEHAKVGDKAKIILGEYAELFTAIGSNLFANETHEFDK